MVPKIGFVIAMILAALCAFCSKKKTQGDTEFTSSTKTATTPAPATSQDIFDEFYKEDSGVSKSVKSKKNEPVVRSSAAAAPVFSERGRFVVQVSTLPSRSLAGALSEKLRSRGYPAYVAEVNNPTPALTGTYYRVRIGGFTGVSLARSFGENHLVPDGYDFWVDNRSNDNVGISGSGMGVGTGSYYETSTAPAADDYQSSSKSYYQTTYEQPSTPQSPPAYEASGSTPGSSVSAQSQTSTQPPPAPSSTGSPAQSEWGNSDEW